MKSYVFETPCVDSDADSILKMRAAAKQVSYKTMLMHCDSLLWVAARLGYAYATPSGLTLKNDPHVRYYKSFYRGRPCYYFVWSHIEYIWVRPS